MSYAETLLETHPWRGHVDKAALTRCIESCFECAQSCTACADACLSEENVAELRKCIRLNLDCADICEAAGRVLTRQTEYDAPTSQLLLATCHGACATCADECERHADMHEHCRVCGEACRRCERSCEALLAAMK